MEEKMEIIKGNQFSDFIDAVTKKFDSLGSLLSDIKTYQERNRTVVEKMLQPNNDIQLNFLAQSVYIDNTSGTTDVVLQSAIRKTSFIMKAGTQGWVHPLGGNLFTIFSPNGKSFNIPALFSDTFISSDGGLNSVLTLSSTANTSIIYQKSFGAGNLLTTDNSGYVSVPTVRSRNLIVLNTTSQQITINPFYGSSVMNSATGNIYGANPDGTINIGAGWLQLLSSKELSHFDSGYDLLEMVWNSTTAPTSGQIIFMLVNNI